MLGLVRVGERNKQIARKLDISASTLNFQIKQIAAILGASGSGPAALARSSAEAGNDRVDVKPGR